LVLVSFLAAIQRTATIIFLQPLIPYMGKKISACDWSDKKTPAWFPTYKQNLDALG